MHVLAPLFDDLHSILKAQGAGGDKCGIFPQTVAGNDMIVQSGDLLQQHPETADIPGTDDGLGEDGLMDLWDLDNLLEEVSRLLGNML